MTVTGVDDALADGDQAYMVLLAATSTDLNYNGLDPDDVSVTNEDDLTVTITAGTSPVTEGTDATFTVTASAMPSSALTVNVSVTDSGSFISGSAPTTVTINPGSTSATLTVATDDDSTDEVNGTITAEVTTGSGYAVGTPSRAMVTVTDNDAPPTSITLTVDTSSLSEGAGATDVMVTATFDGGTTVSAATTVTLSLGGTATGGGTDYSATAPTITITAGDLMGTATLRITPTG